MATVREMLARCVQGAIRDGMKWPCGCAVDDCAEANRLWDALVECRADEEPALFAAYLRHFTDQLDAMERAQ